MKVIRSVSDVIALNIEKVDTNCKDFLSLDSNSSNTANPPKIYTNIEQQNRRNSAESSAAHKTRQNRLLLLKKRHSGFHLRRPEILETVYSVSLVERMHLSSLELLPYILAAVLIHILLTPGFYFTG